MGVARGTKLGSVTDDRARRSPRVWAAVVAGLVSTGIATVLERRWPELGAAQRATRDSFAAVVAQGQLSTALMVDFVFIAAYVTFTITVFSLITDPDHPASCHPAAIAGIILVGIGALGDVVENLILNWVLNHPAELNWLGAMRAAGLVKWAALGSALVLLASLVWTRAWRCPQPPGSPTERPPGADEWSPPAASKEDPRVGVCVSGGGVRSAIFCLGALQALGAKGIMKKATYLAAVSGGGYLAAGWALSNARPPGDNDPASDDGDVRWAPGSPEERWFRDHSSYLIPNFRRGLGGVARLVGGIAVNLAVISLVLFAIARPVGWVIHSIHPRLRAGDTALMRDRLGEMALADVAASPSSVFDGSTPLQRYRVNLVPAIDEPTRGGRNQVCLDLEPYSAKDRDRCFGVEQLRPGVVEVRAGRARVVRQPVVTIVRTSDCPPDTLRNNTACALSIERQPTLRLTSTLVDDAGDLEDQLRLSRQPLVRSDSGLAGVGYPRFEWWMWELSLGLLGVGLVMALVTTTLRVDIGPHGVLRSLASALGAAGLIALSVTVVLPWLTVWIPRTLGEIFGGVPRVAEAESPTGSGLVDYLLPGGGFLTLALTAARQVLSGGKQGSGTSPSRPWYRRVFGLMRKATVQLRWYETSPMKIALVIVTPVVALVAFVGQLQYATANGWSGRLMGFAFVRDFIPYSLWPREWLKEVIVVGMLGVFWLGVDAHAWSLYPFYKRRLSSAFLLRRSGPVRAAPVDYREMLPFVPKDAPKEPGAWKGLPLPTVDQPQLVVCCAVNLSEYGVTPPGRRAASFSFSSSEIGGPVVGYATPQEYSVLPEPRQRDLTVASAMAISGAAFSPAMGKFNLGPLGSVLALANLRLGVWFPNPRWVKGQGPDANHNRWWRLARPGWPWFLRELFNNYGLNRRYLYVSDGGHWDNLGLVELLRRGCTEIYCVSCAGDGADSFGTIGEAIALAREEVGVEIHLDPSPLRAPIGEAGPGRQLRRNGPKNAPEPFAVARAVKGRFIYTNSPEKETGTIWYVEADLTNNMAFDVHAFAESEPIFPDDSTGDQVFNHRQFEAYRRLGYHQGEAME